jgi:hypothetical protein
VYSRANELDSTLNRRTRSDNYDVSLNATYPVIDRYSLSGGVFWTANHMLEAADLFDLNSLGARVDLHYAYNTQRDLFAGYRFRTQNTTGLSRHNDHDFHAGVSGRILPKLNGSLSVGYQFRKGGNLTSRDYGTLSATASATWTLSKKANLTGRLLRDFATLVSDTATLSTRGSLVGTYALSSRWSLSAGADLGQIDFLNRPREARTDTSAGLNAAVHYSMNDHLKVSLGYAYLKNWSALPTLDYDRSTLSLNVSSRW